VGQESRGLAEENSMRRRVLIYGATGYTGRLIADRLRNSRCHSVVAGRTSHRVQALAAEFGVAGRVIAIDEPNALDQALDDIDVLINAASPFSLTAPALIESCLRTRTHYLDITGELPVFQAAFGYDEAARKRGIMIMPGAALGVVASDCLAMHVAALVPNAKYLRIALLRPNSFSRGTFRSALGIANSRVSIRRNGRLMSVPVGRLQRTFDFGEGEKESVAVSWADVFTAYYSTGIRNIETYFEAGYTARALYQLGAGIADTMQLAPARTLIDAVASVLPEGPHAARRRAEQCVIVSEAEDSWRRRRCVRLTTPDGYSFTSEAATAIAQRILQGDFASGFQTPAKVYGADLVLGFKGTDRQELHQPFSAHERMMS
jgi:saccharopine dehydrogenase (NAD+, L-lysine-forming)